MRSLIITSIILFFSVALNAQDSTCQKLTTLMDLQKGKKKSTRMMMTQPMNEMVVMTEMDTSSNFHTLTKMKMNGRAMNMEGIFFCDKVYMKIDSGEWSITKMDFAKVEAMKKQMLALNKDNMLPKNCQQLEDEIINGENCFVFVTESEFTMPAMEGMKTTTPTISKIKTKMWLTEQGDTKKMELNMGLSDNAMKSTVEYDPKIVITEPFVKH